MARTKTLSALAVALGLLCLPLAVQAQTNVLKNTVTGNPEIKSIEAISFAPGGVLLIGDSKGAQVVAIDTGDTQSKSWTKTERANINEELAGRLGTKAKNIQIMKMAVNPASQTAYIAVRNLNTKTDVLLTVDGDGKIAEFPLEKVKYVRVALPANEKSPLTKITDITFAKDRILLAAQANETFASKIVSIPVPLDSAAKAVLFSTETFHVGHNKWETKAPIRTILPYEEEGKQSVIGTFTCTPVVKYSLDELKPGATVKGISVIELGTGNTPQDMFTYKKNGKTYILQNNFRMFHKNNPVGTSPYWTAKVDYNILKETEKINEKAVWRTKKKASENLTDFAAPVPAYDGVMHMDKLNDQQALVIRTDGKDGLNLAVLMLP